MVDFFEVDEKTNKIKSLNLDDLSVDELKIYINELSKEIKRVEEEIDKKIKIKRNADAMFK